MARSFTLLAAVPAKTVIHIRYLFFAELPFSLYVVLRDRSASRFLRLSLLFVVSWVRQVAVLAFACHTQVHTLLFQLLFAALISVLVDSVVFASIFFGTGITVVPA